MSSSTLLPAKVLEVVDTLEPPGTPLTTPEVAAEFDCTHRTVYNKLEALVEDGPLETKKVGARGRVWWRPVSGEPEGTGNSNGPRERIRSHPVFDSEMVGVIVWGSNLAISDANDAFLEMSGLEYDEALGTSWRDLTPEEFFVNSKRHIEQVEETDSGVPYEKQYYHADGSRWWGLFESRKLDDEYVEFVIDVTERKRLKRELQTEKEQLDIAVENSPLVLFRMDTDLRYTWLKNPDPDFRDVDMLGKRDDELLPPEAAETLLAPKRTVLETGEAVREELTYELPSGEVTYDLTVSPVQDESGEVTGLTCAALDITERKKAEEKLKRTNQSLERLNSASADLIDAETDEIAARTAELTRDVLNVEYAGLWSYDDQTGEIDEYASYTADGVDVDAVNFPENFSEQVWQTFIGDETDIETDLVVPERRSAESTLESLVLVPLGRHGVVCVASTRTDTFDDRTIDLAETVAATVETAWDRAESEQELTRRNEELTRLDRLNALIRGIDQVLVEADTVETIDDAVCERLAESALYEFAWIGEYDAETRTVEPRAWAGVDSGYLDRLATRVPDSEANGSPFAGAVRTGELQVVVDVATDARAAPWREDTLERGGRSCLCIPLVYDDSVYGVLTVYGGTPQQEARDAEVLAELGRTIAYAIHAVETRDSLRTDAVYELTLQSTTAEPPLCRLSRTTDCVIEFEGQVPGVDGPTTVFFTVTGIDPDEFVTASEQSVAVDEIVRLDERDDGGLYKARLAEPTLAGLLIQQGASVCTLSIDAGTATAVVDLPDTKEVSTFLTTVRTPVPDLELLARRTRTRSLEADLTLQTTFEERLTPRQQEVLQLAYRSGFFESPRLQTGKELSEALDISQSTFNYHLRGAQRTLFELVFEPVQTAT
ncbi:MULTISPECIES: bacterio-opsin activator domain-containing protein [Natrialbaceae]|uniref:bacterio-opsin activator domain-containing protein n=1 Tax=Natrialbaceae TaxID=1644061 RepID=UPI00207C4204|nr:bacterio-opsin activator domain-containing protein [Natronococcus sp. CG52]